MSAPSSAGSPTADRARTPRLPALAALLALALLAGTTPAQQTVIVETLGEEQVRPRARVIGSLRAASSAVIAALEEGALVEVTVKEGARVQAGDVLARTDRRRLDALMDETVAELAAARASLEQRRAELTNALRDEQAMEAAAADHAVSDRSLREARTEARVSEALVSAHEAAVARIEGRRALLAVRLEDSVVRAPFDAEVVARHAEPGEWIRAGEPIVSLDSTGTIEAWLQVPERHAQELDVTAPVRVELSETDAATVGQGLRVLAQVDVQARTFPVIVDLPNDDGALKPGMSVAAWLPVGVEARRLVVPKDAVLRRGGAVFVFRVSGEGDAARAEQVAVQPLFELDDRVALAPGALAAGDRVVVEGNERLLPGAPVRAVSAAERPETTR